MASRRAAVRITVAGASSVLTCAAPRPGKCLAVAATPPARQPATDSRAARATASGSSPNDRPASAAPATVGDVHDGREADGDPGRAQRPRGRPRVGADGARGGLLRGGRRGRRPGQDPDLAALLVDGDERIPARGPQRRG